MQEFMYFKDLDGRVLAFTSKEEAYKFSNKNLVEISPDRVSTSSFTLDEVERLWRDTELDRSDIELNKVQDSDPKAVGTVGQWRDYRKALRAWPENPDFPNADKRPFAPDVQ